MKENYRIVIETSGDYKTNKEFTKQVSLTERQYLSLVGIVLDFIDDSQSIDEVSINTK